MSRRRLGARSTAGVVLALAGCGVVGEDQWQGISVENLTDGPVEVRYLAVWDEDGQWAPGEMEVIRLTRGDTGGFNHLPAEAGHTVAPLVALDEDGNEVERLEPPVEIEADVEWTIDGRPDG